MKDDKIQFNKTISRIGIAEQIIKKISFIEDYQAKDYQIMKPIWFNHLVVLGQQKAINKQQKLYR